MRRGVLAITLGLLFAATAAGVVFAVTGSGSSERTPRGSTPPAKFELPAFVLRDAISGELIDSSALDSKVVLVTFVDTQCRDACPLLAWQIGRGIERLEPSERARVTALAISVDPRGDTIDSVRAYLRRYKVERSLRYLVGTEAELRPVWESFFVLSSLDSGLDDAHSAPVQIYDVSGLWFSTLRPRSDLTPENLAHDVRLALVNGH